MKAAYQDRYGPPELVEIRDVDRPVPGDGQVLVQVKAASVNRADLDRLKPKPGFLRLFMGLRAPLRPVIDRRYPLERVVEALRYVEDGHPRGKVIINVS